MTVISNISETATFKITAKTLHLILFCKQMLRIQKAINDQPHFIIVQMKQASSKEGPYLVQTCRMAGHKFQGVSA